MKSSAVKPGYSTMAICMIPPLGESPAVLVGRNAHSSNEVAPQRFRAAESAARGDRGDGVVGFLESSACRLGADSLDVRAGRLADLVGEKAGEMSRAHRGTTGQLGDTVRGAGFGFDRLL